MQANDFNVKVEDTYDLDVIKYRYQVPTQLKSCHTAIVDGYVIEGHVSIAEIERLLAERPDVLGIAVPGMPVGSPGMEAPGYPAQPYDVLSFDSSGNIEVFASYP